MHYHLITSDRSLVYVILFVICACYIHFVFINTIISIMRYMILNEIHSLYIYVCFLVIRSNNRKVTVTTNMSGAH